ncbi:unnamed protein product [Callosobruchus maculatus]|uniref:Ubiquitin-conjugating enzyme E2 T n=3 Tax=Callosobruchus maculatus TaxID=64391 RepID=A0A653C7U7_CALMS|nr:unnamed protein product [Callosobruchus maculatus]
MQRQRISKELSKMQNNPPQGICIFAKDDKLMLESKIKGPEGSPYESGVFTLEIQIPERYPFAPPSIRFVNRVYHPNVDDNGRICLDLLKMPPSGGWKPTIGIEGLLIAVRMLLDSPNPDDPLMSDIASEYKQDRQEFIRKAKECTEQYAT